MINDKTYPLWDQFVEKKEGWIGGLLEDSGDSMDRAMGMKDARTEIIDIQLNPNGKDSAFFEIVGKKFSCGFDVQCGGVTAGEEDWITFSEYGDYTFRAKRAVETVWKQKN